MKYMSRGMRKRNIFFVLVAVLALFGVVSCKDTSESTPPVEEVTGYTVTFNNNGHGTTPNKVKNVTELPNPLPILSDLEWKFVGWYFDTGLTNEAKPGAEIKENTILYAKWIEKVEEGPKTITIAEALVICSGLESTSGERYIINAEVVKILNPAYGQMQIKDDTGTIEVYGSYDADGTNGYATLEDKPYAGDTVSLSCLLQNYNGKYEVKSAWILSFTHEEQKFDINEYEAMSIEEARAKEAGTKVILEGVVARITYANGRIPSGFYLIDDTNSIYVYDSQNTPRVAIGNKIKIAATKDYWILADEVASAQHFKYEGCCQVTDGHLLENDEKTDNVYAKSWIKESTVKEILDTPVSENITTTIYKVNALVKKVEGTGFVNYYFYDLDKKTGSYTYTQCNGGDFAWLDEFDGKVCTVYLSVINARSTLSGCVWRFLPIEVIDEGYTFDLNKTAEFVVKYYGLPQFRTFYAGNPELNCVTKASSKFLGFENVKLTYTSSNPDLLSFDEVEGKIIMNIKADGKVTISVKSSYNNIEYTEDIEVTIEIVEIPENTMTVAEAIATDPHYIEEGAPAEAKEGTMVTVRGIAGPSLVNQVGFYLIDETGVIAVRTSADVMKDIFFGNEVIIMGRRTVANTDKGVYGQSVVTDSKLVANLYGNHMYSKASFLSNKTLEELMATPTTEDPTTQVYNVLAKVKVEESAYYTRISLVSPENESKTINLYSSSAKQYGWLTDYNGKTLRFELALCNWKAKGYFSACALSATLDDGTVLYNTLNYSS